MKEMKDFIQDLYNNAKPDNSGRFIVDLETATKIVCESFVGGMNFERSIAKEIHPSKKQIRLAK